MKSKLKLLLGLTVCLAVLFAPFLLKGSLDGKAYAMGFLGSSGGNGGGDDLSSSTVAPTTKPESPPVSQNPEPATMLLFGAGAVGLAVAKKKFKKK